MILDKLIEKKDLSAYISFRIEQLSYDLQTYKELPEKKRELFRQRTIGRIKELTQLRKHINDIKKQSIRTSESVYKLRKENDAPIPRLESEE